MAKAKATPKKKLTADQKTIIAKDEELARLANQLHTLGYEKRRVETERDAYKAQLKDAEERGGDLYLQNHNARSALLAVHEAACEAGKEYDFSYAAGKVKGIVESTLAHGGGGTNYITAETLRKREQWERDQDDKRRNRREGRPY